MLTEIYGPREMWPQFQWRQADTRDLQETLEFGTFANPSEILQEAHALGLAGASAAGARMGAHRSLSDPLPNQEPVVVNPFSINPEMETQSRVDQMNVVNPSVSGALAAEMYPGATMSDPSSMYYQTVTPPGEVGGLPAPAYHPLPHVYQQAPYAEHPVYQIAQPVPFPPVASNNILASDTFYSPRPIAQVQRSQLPPHTHSAPPVPPTPPHQDRRHSRHSKSSLGKRLFGLSSRKSSESNGSQRMRADKPIDSPQSADAAETGYLSGGYHTDSFL